MLNNEVIQIYIEGSAAGLYPAITLLDIMTDSTGIPILARKMILISSEFNLSKEGSDFFVYQNMLTSFKDGFNKAKNKPLLYQFTKQSSLLYCILS